jgi:hypothetical protein
MIARQILIQNLQDPFGDIVEWTIRRSHGMFRYESLAEVKRRGSHLSRLMTRLCEKASAKSADRARSPYSVWEICPRCAAGSAERSATGAGLKGIVDHDATATDRNPNLRLIGAELTLAGAVIEVVVRTGHRGAEVYEERVSFLMAVNADSIFTGLSQTGSRKKNGHGRGGKGGGDDSRSAIHF